MKVLIILQIYQMYKFYIYPVIIAISCLILIILVIFPQLSNFFSGQNTEKDLNKRIKILGIKAAALEKFDEKDLRLKVNYLLAALPTEKDYVSILSILQNICSEFGFTISQFSPGGNDSKSEAQSYTVQLNIDGPKALLPSLLKEIEGVNRVMKIDSIDLSQAKDSRSLGVNLSIQVFFAPAPSTFGNVESEIPVLSDKDEELINKLSKAGSIVVPNTINQPLVTGPIGKSNPFE